MKNVYTVKQVNAYVKNMFSQDYMLNRIYVRGEVSNLKYHTSGHIYFSLKDESGTIACVMFAGQRTGLSFHIKEGHQVIVFGSITVYERDGKYQLYAKEIRLDGEGVLYERFQALKAELEDMGMFAPEYKKKIPAYNFKIGVVTAPTGAAIRDIINITQRRNPYVQILLYPALVQGKDAAPSIVKGIRKLEEAQVDVMIVGRGGGSLEDLWAFNEEMVARAVFACEIPVISAVGHETDTTIIDYVADMRAPTPSAAAELAVFEYARFQENIAQREQRFTRLMRHQIDLARLKYKQYQTKMSYLGPKAKLYDYHMKLAELEEKLPIMMAKRIAEEREKSASIEAGISSAMKEKLQADKHTFALLIERMKGLSPLDKLSQGYSYTQTTDGKNIRSVAQIHPGDALQIMVTDGMIEAEVTGKKEKKSGEE